MTAKYLGASLISVIKNFIQSGNNPDLAYVIPYPHWVDTRLVGFNAGYPGKDYAILGDEISDTKEISGDKLFIFKPEDSDTLTELDRCYSDGEASVLLIGTLEIHR